MTLTNQGLLAIKSPVRVNLYASTDEIIDRASDEKLVNDALLTTAITTAKLGPGESKTIELEYANITSVGAPGACNLILEVDPKNRVFESSESNNQVWEQISALPNQSQLFDRQLAQSLAEITDSPEAEANGIAFGKFVADTIIASRANDGSSNNSPYVPPAGDYVWRPNTEGAVESSPREAFIPPQIKDYGLGIPACLAKI